MISDQAKAPPKISIVMNSNRFQSNRRGQVNFNNHGRGRFHTSPNIRYPRVASRTSDKDKLHCHYCHEICHFIKDCRMCITDERNAAKFSLLGDIPENWLYVEKDSSLDSDLDSDTDPMDDLNICWK